MLTQREKGIFGISNPQDRFCQLTHFISTHKMLEVGVIDKENQHIGRILFNRVAYLECATFWKGADFQFADEQMLSKFINDTGFNLGEKPKLVLLTVKSYEGNTYRFLALGAKCETQSGTFEPALPPLFS